MTTKFRVRHYAGEIIYANGHVLPGWAACCSGFKAEAIAEAHAHTYVRQRVTCRACQKMLEKHDAWRREHEGG